MYALEETHQRKYFWLFHNIQIPSESLINRQINANHLALKPLHPISLEISLALKKEKSLNSILCIEGGGTYFRLDVLELKHSKGSPFEGYHVLKNFKVLGGNINVIGWDKFSGLVDNALKTLQLQSSSLLNYIKINQPLIVAGMAGMGGLANQLKLQQYFADATNTKQEKCLIVSDAEATLATLPSYGALLISGTGSICMGLGPEGTKTQAGGLGANLSGDPGSAFAIGKQAILHSLNISNNAPIWDEYSKQFIDGSDNFYKALKFWVQAIFGIDKFDQKFGAVLNKDRQNQYKLAELAPIVFKYAFSQGEMNSLLAQNIIKGAAKDLAIQVAEVYQSIIQNRLELMLQIFNVLLVGGIFKNKYQAKFLALIEAHLRTIHPNIRINWQHNKSTNYVKDFVLSSLESCNNIKNSNLSPR